MKNILITIILAFSSIALTANAQNTKVLPKSSYGSSFVLSGILVEGNQRVEANTIRSFTGLATGSRVTAGEIDNALANVFNSGLFADASIRRKGSKIVVSVKENPVIADVTFAGNKKIKEDDLLSEIKTAPRAIFNQALLKRDIVRIKSLYKRKGRYSTQVRPRIKYLNENLVNLEFDIVEGAKTTVQNINFEGNSEFSDSKLRRVISTKETSILRFLSNADKLDQDRLNYDTELLRKHYVNRGFADFKILSADARLDESGKGFNINFEVDEGTEYRFGDSKIQSEAGFVEGEDLSKTIESDKGDTFDARLVKATVENIKQELGERGFAFVDVGTRYNRREADGMIDVVYNIAEGARVYIENINISGNTRTLDKVVRREFRLAEGDPFNIAQIQRSIQRVSNLGYFKDVNLDTTTGSAPDKINVNIDLEEQATGEFSFGGGFSSTDGVVGNISLSERNLLGKGWRGSVAGTISQSTQQASISFTEPYLFGRDIALGGDLYYRNLEGDNSINNRTYDNAAYGGGLQMSYPIMEHLRHSLYYNYDFEEITNVSVDASLFVTSQQGDYTTSSFGHTLVYDKLDNRFSPTKGFYLRLNQEYAGAGGDVEYFKHEGTARAYYPLYKKDVILKLAANAGHIKGEGGQDVRINDRFFIGSKQLRGFDNQGIGPRDVATLDPLGGNIYATASAEIQFPIGLPQEYGIKASVFVDAGTLYELDALDRDPTLAIYDEDSIRASYGAGISWNSPIGPLRIDYAEAFQKEDFDELEKFRFSVGTRF